MLEPRRIAAVSAARWMAKTLNEQAGETVGYAIRFDTKISAKTRIEVVTEGVLTRRIQSDPGLEGTAMVIFDEFHERSIHADRARPLPRRPKRPAYGPEDPGHVRHPDPGPIAALLGNAQVITSSGKAFPVEERYLEDRGGPLWRALLARSRGRSKRPAAISSCSFRAQARYGLPSRSFRDR